MASFRTLENARGCVILESGVTLRVCEYDDGFWIEKQRAPRHTFKLHAGPFQNKENAVISMLNSAKDEIFGKNPIKSP